MTRLAVATCVALALLPFAAFAYPDGAPWSALDHRGQRCTACHADFPAVEESPAISLVGAEQGMVAGERYRMALRIDAPEGEVTGFMGLFDSVDGSAGEVSSGPEIAVQGTKFRSAATRPIGQAGAQWNFEWTAPAAPGEVLLLVAATVANDDMSPLGDTVHFATVPLTVRSAPD